MVKIFEDFGTDEQYVVVNETDRGYECSVNHGPYHKITSFDFYKLKNEQYTRVVDLWKTRESCALSLYYLLVINYSTPDKVDYRECLKMFIGLFPKHWLLLGLDKLRPYLLDYLKEHEEDWRNL